MDNLVDYEKVLIDLKNRRQSISDAITGIEAMLSLVSQAPSTQTDPAQGTGKENLGPNTFLSMNLRDAAIKYLGIVHQKQTTTDIARGLEAGGFHHQSKTFNTTVHTALFREHEKNGAIVKIGPGEWGLREWYPGIRAKKSPSLDSVKEKSEEPEGMEDIPIDDDQADPFPFAPGVRNDHETHDDLPF